MIQTRVLAVVLVLVAAVCAACGGDGDEDGDAPEPAEYIATFRVGDVETYRIRLTDRADIEIAQLLISGDETAPTIPNGLIVRGESDVNEGYSWHIDPASLEFADVTTEVCDGLPSHVEDGTLSGDRFCPWSAELTELRPA